MTTLDEKYDTYFRAREEERAKLNQRINHGHSVNNRREHQARISDSENRTSIRNEDGGYDLDDEVYKKLEKISTSFEIQRARFGHHQSPKISFDSCSTAIQVAQNLMNKLRNRKINQVQYNFLCGHSRKDLYKKLDEDCNTEYQKVISGQTNKIPQSQCDAIEIAEQEVLKKYGIISGVKQ